MLLDKSQFLAIFLDEAKGYLTTLNQGLVQLEKDPKNRELLNELFRAAHTLKGASRMMGFTEIQDLAHKVEDLFGLLKEEKLNFNQETADQVFKSVDAMMAAVQGIDVSPSSRTSSTSEMRSFRIEGEGEKRAVSPPEGVEYIRLPSERVDNLLNLIGEVVINKVKSSYKMRLFKLLSKQAKGVESLLFEIETSIKEALGVQDEVIQHRGAVLHASREMEKASDLLGRLHRIEALMGGLRDGVNRLSDEIQAETLHINPIIEDLQRKMKEIRMLPCSTIFEGFPRLVRDIAKEQKKEIEFIIKGKETELDKKVLEAMKGPLIHLLRNAVDHGIEKKGTVTLSAFQEGGQVIIEVADDGRGIDLALIKETAIRKGVLNKEELETMEDKEVLNLIFAEGFSTAPIITDVSGRGVGMDVVRTEMERLKGTVDVRSRKGAGTTVRLELPLTIAILQVLLVEASGIRWAFPTAGIEESLRVSADQIATIENRMIIQVRGRSMPVVSLPEVLGLQAVKKTGKKGSEAREKTVVVINSLNKRVGFIVDRLLGEEEVFIKNLGPHLGKVKGVSGATILASGEVVVILDIQDLIMQAELAHPAVKARKKRAIRKKNRILLVEDSFTTRELERTILENSGYDVETAIDGLDAMEKLSQTTFDVIVSDIQMPRMDGFEFCKNVKKNEKLKEIPVVFVTALSKDEEKRRGIELGAAAYLTKSEFDQRNLLETIERLI